jgi:predicted ATPase
MSELLESQAESRITILTGSNNCGKSAYLKKAVTDRSNLYIGVNRFYSFHHMPLYTDNRHELDSWYNDHQSSYQREWQNTENSHFNTQTALTRLTNDQRALLFEVFNELFDTRIEVKPEDPDNEFSNRYISIGGDSLSVTSSGTRLFLGLLAALMDERFSAVAIDEPELGLSPTLQRKLADIIIRGVNRSRLLPHNPRIILSTHSHLFLDRTTPSNNWIVSKEGNLIRASQCRNLTELHEIQFKLLGNDLGELLLPDAVMFVEGPTDKEYLEKIILLKLPNPRIVIEACGGNIAERLNYWGSSLGDMQISPYRLRTFIVYDRVKQAGLERVCDRLGVPAGHRVEWAGNGIEYVYPLQALSAIYKAQLSAHSELSIADDYVSFGEIGYKKAELCRMVCSITNEESALPAELCTKLLNPLRDALL